MVVSSHFPPFYSGAETASSVAFAPGWAGGAIHIFGWPFPVLNLNLNVNRNPVVREGDYD